MVIVVIGGGIAGAAAKAGPGPALRWQRPPQAKTDTSEPL